MSKSFIHRLFISIASILILAQPALAAEGGSGPLVSVRGFRRI
jgi:hypothetical protein